MTIILQRTQEDDKQTLGELFVDDKKFYTLELVWEDNKRQISRIPSGVYNITKRYSQKYGDHFHILDVVNRDYILIHKGNFNKDTLGCILVGDDLKDINGDGYLDLTNSVKTMQLLNELLPNKFRIEIKDIKKKPAAIILNTPDISIENVKSNIHIDYNSIKKA